MSRAAQRTAGPGGRAFTLLELLVATFIFAVLAGALYSIFGGALRLRERTYAAVEQELPATAALDILRRDLACMVIPVDADSTNTLAGAMLGTASRKGDRASDTLEFRTASGAVRDALEDPWGDIQQVTWLLADPNTNTGTPGQELVREVTRNLLSAASVEPARQRLLAGVRSLQFEYYADEAWVDSWDSEANENAPPEAVRVRVEFEPEADGDRPRPPLELVCEIAAQPEADDEATTGTGTSS